MPHLQIQYSKNLETRTDMSVLCARLAQEIVAIGLFPLGGVRVRAMAADHAAIADLHPQNAFVDMVFRIGAGRSDEDKRQTGGRLMALAEAHFADELASEHFMLSLEIVEIDTAYSWKTNTIHKRLREESNNVA